MTVDRAASVFAGFCPAIRNFDAAPYKHPKQEDIWLPQLCNFTYLEMEQK